MSKDMMVQRKTAAKYLDKIAETGLLRKVKIGRYNYYINWELMELFVSHALPQNEQTPQIESVNT